MPCYANRKCNINIHKFKTKNILQFQTKTLKWLLTKLSKMEARHLQKFHSKEMKISKAKFYRKGFCLLKKNLQLIST